MTTATLTPHVGDKPHAGLHSSLWFGQVALALVFGAAGLMKMLQPLSRLAERMAWVSDVPLWSVRFIGTCELLGAVGVIVPALLGIRRGLTVLAAAALAAVMVLATLFHLVRGEYLALPVTLVLGAVAAFVVWGRVGKGRFAEP